MLKNEGHSAGNRHQQHCIRGRQGDPPPATREHRREAWRHRVVGRILRPRVVWTLLLKTVLLRAGLLGVVLSG